MKPIRDEASYQKAKREGLLLRGQNFVSGEGTLSFEPRPLACEASAPTTELTAPNHIYFNPKSQLCKQGALAPKTAIANSAQI